MPRGYRTREPAKQRMDFPSLPQPTMLSDIIENFQNLSRQLPPDDRNNNAPRHAVQRAPETNVLLTLGTMGEPCDADAENPTTVGKKSSGVGGSRDEGDRLDEEERNSRRWVWRQLSSIWPCGGRSRTPISTDTTARQGHTGSNNPSPPPLWADRVKAYISGLWLFRKSSRRPASGWERMKTPDGGEVV